jgi:hypothetical protein
MKVKMFYQMKRRKKKYVYVGGGTGDGGTGMAFKIVQNSSNTRNAN